MRKIDTKIKCPNCCCIFDVKRIKDAIILNLIDYLKDEKKRKDGSRKDN